MRLMTYLLLFIFKKGIQIQEKKMVTMNESRKTFKKLLKLKTLDKNFQK